MRCCASVCDVACVACEPTARRSRHRGRWMISASRAVRASRRAARVSSRHRAVCCWRAGLPQDGSLAQSAVICRPHLLGLHLLGLRVPAPRDAVGILPPTVRGCSLPPACARPPTSPGRAGSAEGPDEGFKGPRSVAKGCTPSKGAGGPCACRRQTVASHSRRREYADCISSVREREGAPRRAARGAAGWPATCGSRGGAAGCRRPRRRRCRCAAGRPRRPPPRGACGGRPEHTQWAHCPPLSSTVQME